LYNPRREILAYRSLLNPEQFGTPVCYGAVEEHEADRYWLFLERVEGVLLWQVGRFEQWERAAGWLAGFHAHFSGKAQRQALPELLLRYDSEHCRRWIERATRFVTQNNAGLSVTSASRFRRLVKQYDRVADRLSSTAQTVIHGEFYPSNIILRGGARGTQLCPIDWEVAAIGPGCIDLAALVSGAWSEEQKAGLVKAYHRALVGLGANAPGLKELMELVDYAQLHLAIQWLGWASDWSPPKNHERDWLDEAIRVANRLKLI
jgi:thiamine kinase-like enzyme